MLSRMYLEHLPEPLSVLSFCGFHPPLVSLEEQFNIFFDESELSEANEMEHMFQYILFPVSRKVKQEMIPPASIVFGKACK